MRYTAIIATLFIVLTVGSAQVNTITNVIKSNPSFSILYQLLQSTGLDYTLSQTTLYTLFAPNNTAFKALPQSTLKALLNPQNGQLLSSVLLYHVLPGAFYSNQLALSGNNTLVSAQGSTITLNARSPFGFLTSYVVSLNNARVIKSNIPASNGLVHAIDRVLLADDWQFTSPFPNIFGLISQDPNLSTLTFALQATGLDQVLTSYGPGQYTLFAPTNDAFSDPLLAPLFGLGYRDALKQVLLYHVLGQPVFSTELFDGLTATTLSSGATLTISRTSFLGVSATSVNDASILSVDNSASNGVYHTIDRVLLPFSFI